MTKQETINANVCLLAQQAHAAGAEPGTVLTYRTGDAPEPVSPVKVHTCTITYAGVDNDDKPLLGFQLNDKLLGMARVDNVEPMRFATKLVMKTKGYKQVGTRWVNPDEPAGAKAIELGRCKWKGLANNPEFLTSQGKVYGNQSSVGTTASSTASAAKPDTLCIPIEGSEEFLPPLEPRPPAKKHKKSEEESEEESEESEEESEAAAYSKKKKKKTAKAAPKGKGQAKQKPTTNPGKTNGKKGGKKGPKKDILIKMGGKGCPKGHLGEIHAYPLEHVDDPKKLAKIHARYFGKTPPPPASGKHPNAIITHAVMRNELSELWGM